MKNKFAALKIIVLSLMFVSVESVKADDLNPYLDGAEHRITAREYDDLRSYVERAQKILQRTLDDSTAFSGTELRNRLLRGMQTALQSTDLRHELLLFRYVLSRAVEIDAFYIKEVTGAKTAQLSAQAVLLPAIESALAYYQSSDLPRLATTTVPSPDWLSFAADQVPHLLRAVDLAPSAEKKVEVVKRALGWTAKALNSAHERRSSEVADHIVRLGELYNDPNSAHPQYVTLAQDALLAVYKSYRKALPTITLAPASAGTDLKMRRKSWLRMPSVSLPLLNRGSDTPIGREGKGVFGSNEEEGIYVARVNFLLGAGVSGGYDGNEAGAIKAAPALTIEGDASVVDYGDVSLGIMQAHGRLDADLRASGQINDWNYHAKADISAAYLGVLGGFVAIERNVFDRFEDSFLTAGAAPHLMIRIGKMEYVLIRGLAGIANGNCKVKGAECSASRDGAVYGGSIVIKLRRFAATLGGNFMNQGSYEKQSMDRYNIDASVSLPLGVVVKNDVLHLKASAVSYTGAAPGAGAAMMFYGWKW